MSEESERIEKVSAEDIEAAEKYKNEANEYFKSKCFFLNLHY